jgi:diguanylate cyclase (GGDEF)-like protein
MPKPVPAWGNTLTELLKGQSTANLVANALLICVSALLLVVGVQYVHTEISALVRDDARMSAHKWANHLIASDPQTIELLSAPHDGSVLRLERSKTASSNIVSYSIYDKDGRLRVYAGTDTGNQHDHFSRVSIPLSSQGKTIGTLVANVDTSDIYDLLVQGASKIGMILASAIGFIILVSLLVRASATREAQRNITRLMQYDAATGLPNQAAFEEILNSMHQQEIMDQTSTRLMLINIDRFSHINERLGRQSGDQLLREVADRLRAACNDDSLCARIGGDTFAIAASTDNATRTENLEGVFAKPFQLGSQSIRLAASVGVASSHNGAIKPEILQQRAEKAMRAAKASGGQQYVTYDSKVVSELRETERLSALIEEALEKDLFELHYQPVVESCSRKLASFEALIRLTSPEGERISPDRFIPIAELTGRINQIGLWTLREACRTVSGLPKHISMAVNLSPQQFSSATLVQDIEAILAETRVDPKRLELEVTESIMIGDAEPVLEQLRSLQQLGIRIALDDFGTGYSSLSYLWQFKFDKLKIDQAFIRASDDEPKALALLGKIVEVGRTFNMKITAEGIETEEHAERAAYLGCDFSQGYLFGKAIPQTSLACVVISEFAEYIRRQTNGEARFENAGNPEEQPVRSRTATLMN